VVVEGWNKPTWDRSEELLDLREKLRSTEEYSKAIVFGQIPIIQHYPLDGKEALAPHRVYVDACMDGIILYEKDGFLSRVLSGFKRGLAEGGARRVETPDGKFYWIISKSAEEEVR